MIPKHVSQKLCGCSDAWFCTSDCTSPSLLMWLWLSTVTLNFDIFLMWCTHYTITHVDHQSVSTGPLALTACPAYRTLAVGDYFHTDPACEPSASHGGQITSHIGQITSHRSNNNPSEPHSYMHYTAGHRVTKRPGIQAGNCSIADCCLRGSVTVIGG